MSRIFLYVATRSFCVLTFSHARHFLVSWSSVPCDFSFLRFYLLAETLTIWTYYQYGEVKDCRVGVTGMSDELPIG
jgi:hypothetical protein